MDTRFLTNKVILIISPQAWGDMLLAKHHYAIELAKRGNEVYFLNPPDNQNWNWNASRVRIKVKRLAVYRNLYIINQRLFFPYNIKFHSRWIYNFLIKRQIRDILRSIVKPIDILWSFDLGNLFPLSFFNNKLFKIFHPVDEPRDQNAIFAAIGADILFSVTREILRKYEPIGVPAYFINHGLAEEFIVGKLNDINSSDRIKTGMSGNLLRPDLDRRVLLQIIEENPEVVFHFYGSYTIAQSNIGASIGKEVNLFIDALKSYPQVVLHGVLRTSDLATELNKMDVLLICYDIKLDQSNGTNYHKVMEYLSVGKTIISNNIITYCDQPDLIRMAPRIGNEALPALFKETLGNLGKWNAETLVEKRKAFSKNNTYKKQLDRIEAHICELLKPGEK